MYETYMLRQAIGDLQVGIILFPASYWGFAICETFKFWQAIGDLQEKRPPKALHFRQAMEDSESMQIQRRSRSFHFPASYWGFAMYETSMLRQAIGDLQVGIVLFLASYWGFAICETIHFWQAVGDLHRSALLKRFISGRLWRVRNLCKSNTVLDRFSFQQAIGDSPCTKLLCCGKLLGICKWASFYFQQAIGVSRFAKLLSFGKLFGICKRSALLKRFIFGRPLRIRNPCKSNAVLDRFTFCCYLLSRPVALGPTLPFRFLPEWFPFFVHRRVQRSFCRFRACVVLGPTLPPSFLPDWVLSYVHRPVQCKLPCALGPNPLLLFLVGSHPPIYIGIVRWPVRCFLLLSVLPFPCASFPSGSHPLCIGVYSAAFVVSVLALFGSCSPPLASCLFGSSPMYISSVQWLKPASPSLPGCVGLRFACGGGFVSGLGLGSRTYLPRSPAGGNQALVKPRSPILQGKPGIGFSVPSFPSFKGKRARRV